jgi:hypothetical protein
MGVIQPVNLYNLVRLWPILLIVAGLDLLFGRRSPIAGTLIGLLAVIVIVGLLIAGPVLGLPAAPQVKTERFQTPLDGATNARVVLDLESYRTNVRALSGSDQLLDATIVHHGQMALSTSGDTHKEVSLVSTGSAEPWPFLEFNPNARWDVGLSDQIPLDLTVDGGSGSSALSLGGLNLSALKADVGSGSMDITLPPGKAGYTVSLEGGSGSLDVQMPCTNVTLNLHGHSGSQTITIPENCPARVEVLNGGSGSVRVPKTLARMEGQENKNEGAWETADYVPADVRILIVMEDQGSGSFTVRLGSNSLMQNSSSGGES